MMRIEIFNGVKVMDGSLPCGGGRDAWNKMLEAYADI